MVLSNMIKPPQNEKVSCVFYGRLTLVKHLSITAKFQVKYIPIA